jgi:hypothetical protein
MWVASDASFALIVDGGIAILDLKTWTRTRYVLPLQNGPDDVLLEPGDSSFLVTSLDNTNGGSVLTSLDRVRFR